MFYDPWDCMDVTACDPYSPDYDIDWCDESLCDPLSINYDIDECDGSVCDEYSINYDPDECDLSSCAPWSINFDMDECDLSICDPESVNYDPDECDESLCDESSINYDPDECDLSICDPLSINYDIDECDGSSCDEYSINYDPVYCEKSSPCDDKKSANNLLSQNVAANGVTVSMDIGINLGLNAVIGNTEAGMALWYDSDNNLWGAQTQKNGQTVLNSTSTIEIVVSYDCSTAITAHTHTTAASYTTPSAQDVFAVVSRVNYINYDSRTETSCQYANHDYYGEYIIAGLPNGSMVQYFLYVSDPEAAKDFYAANSTSGFVDATTHEFIGGSTITQTYSNALAYFSNNKATLGMNDNDAHDAALAYALQVANTGLTLLKLEPNGQFIPQATQQNSDGTYQQENCN